MRLAALVCALSFCAILVTGCPSKPPTVGALDKDYDATLPPGQLALRKITDPRQIPDFTPACSDLAGLREAVLNSLDYMAKPSSKSHYPYGAVTHEQAVASLNAFLALLDSGLPPQQMNQAIRQQFDVYISVGCDNKGTMLYTGYYTPIFQASLAQSDRFRYPLYRAPAGLTKNPDGTPTVKMPDRRTIEQTNPYAGNELVWLGDPFEAYVAHIQGSAKLRTAEGQEMTVGYTANNGYDYNSIRAEMAKDGKIAKRAGLAQMIAYFKAHPSEVRTYTWRNPRYVFFAPVEDGRPRGCLNEPVTTRRTIATDKAIFPPAGVAFLSPKEAGAIKPGFALDQDAGGAIRAAGRCDLYMGIGEQAGVTAGRTQEEGKLYYLFLKPQQTHTPGLQQMETPALGAAR